MRGAIVAMSTFVSWLPAQQQPIELPVLLRLGSVPVDVPVVTVAGDGAAARAAMPTGIDHVALRADRATPMATVQRVLDAARAHGIARVSLLATLPDRTAGALLLALPLGDDAPSLVTLRAHRERPGVPPESAVPLLRRLRASWQQARRVEPFVLGITVPADAAWAQLVQLIGAAVDAEVASVAVRTVAPAPAAPAGAGGNLALDLEASFVLQVPARERALAAPGVQATMLGAPARAPAAIAAVTAGFVGGTYGGRGGAPKPEADAAAETLQRAIDWLLRQQRADGSFAGEHGRGDVEATALVALLLLGNGSTLDRGPYRAPLARALGWLLAQQRDDGRFADAGPGSLRAHATAAWALGEATGTSAHRELVRGFARAALDSLFAQRRDDGGWNDGTPDAPSDGTSTTFALLAVVAATFFELEPAATADQLVAWFDANARAETGAAAAELLARRCAGQKPTEVAGASMRPDTIADGAPIADPTTCHVATLALFQTGGTAWTRWAARLFDELLPRQLATGAAAGSWPAAPDHTAVATTARFALSLSAFGRSKRMKTGR